MMQARPYDRLGVFATERDSLRILDPEAQRWFSRDNYVADLLCTEPHLTDSDALRLLGSLEVAHCRAEVDEVYDEWLRLRHHPHSTRVAMAERKRDTNIRMASGRLAVRISADHMISDDRRHELVTLLEHASSLENLMKAHVKWYRLRTPSDWTRRQAELLKSHLSVLYQRLTVV